MKKFLNSVWEWILAIVGIVAMMLIMFFAFLAYILAYLLPIAGGVVIAYFIIKLIGG